MTIKKAGLCLFSLYLAIFLLGEALVLVKPFFEPITQLGFMTINKSILTAGLLIFVYSLKIQRQCGLVFKANWRTLPLYWPIALIAGLTLTAGINTDTSGSTMAILLLMVLVGSFGEELMFRGLVFHWFRDLSVRKQILISAFAFGGLHLLGLLTEINPAIIFSQVYLAASFGVIFGYARSQDYSIMIPIMVHIIFNAITLGSQGGVVEAATTAPAEQVVVSLLAVGTITWAWGGYLLWKSGRAGNIAPAQSTISTA